MACSTRKSTELFLLDQPLEKFTDRQLPTGEEVLRRLYSFGCNSKSNREAVVTELVEVWGKARIPTMEIRSIKVKLESVVKKYEKLKINRKRSTDTQQAKEVHFKNELSRLFDISHKDALSSMKNKEDQAFLRDQRTERKMAMGGVDQELVRKETMRMKKLARKSEMAEKEKMAKAEKLATVDLSDSSSPSSGPSSQENSPFRGETSSQVSSSPKKRLKVTPEVVSALDRTNLSDRKATHLLQAVASSSGLTPASRSTLRRSRMMTRTALAEDIKTSFQEFINAEEPPLIVHWDGKLLPDLTGEGEGNLVDRLPIIVSSPALEKEKLLGMPKLPAGTGAAMATKVEEVLGEWGIKEKVVGMSFDTTASNTGIHTGCCRLLEEALGKPLLNLACRHHVIELILAAAFKEVMGPSSGPTIQLFKRFREQWPYIPHEDPEAIDNVVDPRIDLVPSWKEASIGAMERGIQSKKVREDYRELCNLSLFYLTGNLRQPIKKPGAFHHARWMAKAIYVLKIRMFRSHVQMTTREGKGLEEIALFVVLLYSRAWMEAGLATEAAYNDLNLVKDLHHFQEINGAIGKTTLTTFSRHLWYLGADLVGLSLFSERISMEEKKKIAEETRKEKDLDRIRFNKAADQLINSSLPSLTSSASVRALTLLNIDISFLSLPVDEWEANPAYQKGVSTVKNLSVTNDGAERGVAMISSYNDSLTKDEKTKHRRNYPHPH